MIGKQHMTAKGYTGKKKPPVSKDTSIDRHCKHMDIVCSIQNASMVVAQKYKEGCKSFVYNEAEEFITALRNQGYEIREIR